MANRNTICLRYDGTAADAAQFYADTFPDSAVGMTLRAPSDYPDGHDGDVLKVEFTVCGIPYVGLNGGSAFRPDEAFSFQIATDDQAETDRLWNAIVDNDGEESACGWCKDKWDVSWQIAPPSLLDAISDPDPGEAKRSRWANWCQSWVAILRIALGVRSAWPALPALATSAIRRDA